MMNKLIQAGEVAMVVAAALLVATVVLLVIFFLFQGKGGKTPPGPIGLPIVGYLPFMTGQPYVELQKLAKRYGPVYSVQLGSENCIVLSDFQTTKDAFAQDAFMGRPPVNPFDLSKQTLETGAFNGLPWKDQRRFSLQLLKDLGFGKSRLEDMVKEEISDLLTRFEESNGRPVLLRTFLTPSMSNNIASLVYGKRRSYDDPVRIKLDKLLTQGAAAAGQVAWQIFFPWVTKLLRTLGVGQQKKVKAILQESKEFTRAEIKEHLETLDENNIRDYIDGYLVEIRKRKDPAFCLGVLEDMVGAFFGAGSETVKLTTDWLMLTMAGYPDVQKQIQEEIDTVVGGSRGPSYSDQAKMPYTQATIMELMRWRTIIPINVLRYTLFDTKLNGYFIPKDSYVLANLWAIHHDPQYWGEDAEVFRPQRFLSEDRKDIVKSEYFIPFSIGKRSCPGESYARMEVFLYFTSIMQKFNVTLPEGAVPNFDGDLGIGLSPKPFELCINKRS